jgi:hypothetical protein
MSVNSDLLSDLHRRKQAAIDSLDFETAQSLHTEICSRISDDTLTSITSIRSSVFSSLSTSHSSYRQLLDSLLESKRTSTNRLYSEVQVLFEQTRTDHITELTNLENERGFALLCEAEREVPDQIAILHRAKQEAVASNFESAIALRQRARDVGQAELDRRRSEVESDFEFRRLELLARQKSELDEISDFHEREMTRIRREDEQKVENAKTEFVNAANHIRNEAEVKILSLRGSRELKDEAVKALREDVEAAMAEYAELPQMRPIRARAEVMRLTGLCPVNAVKNAMPTEVPASILERVQAKTAKPIILKMNERPLSMSSTRLMTRAYTAVGVRYRRHLAKSVNMK